MHVKSGTHIVHKYTYMLYMKILFKCCELNTWQLSGTLEVIPDGSVSERETEQPYIGQNEKRKKQ